MKIKCIIFGLLSVTHLSAIAFDSQSISTTNLNCSTTVDTASITGALDTITLTATPTTCSTSEKNSAYWKIYDLKDSTVKISIAPAGGGFSPWASTSANTGLMASLPVYFGGSSITWVATFASTGASASVGSIEFCYSKISDGVCSWTATAVGA